MDLMVLIFLFLVLLVGLIALVLSINSLYSLVKYKVPYVSTPDWAIEKIMNTIRLPKQARVYDLGAGNGNFLVAIKSKFPTIRATGFEIAWLPYLQAKRKIRDSGVTIELCHQNFFPTDLSDADLIFCYLIPSVMPRLETKLRTELKPGALVISFGFRFPHWPPKEIIANPNNPKSSKINIYQR